MACACKSRGVGERIGFWSMVVGSVSFGVVMVMVSVALVVQQDNRIYTDMNDRVGSLEVQMTEVINTINGSDDYGSDNSEYR